MPRIKVTDNTKDYIKHLKKKHGGLAVVSAETVNTAAKVVKKRYIKELEDFVLRNKFTKGAVKLFKSKAQRSKGGFREIRDINAVVGVRKMKGSKPHYLQKQEEGATKRGTGATKGGVPIPLDVARAGKSHGKPIKRALRLQNSATIQTLKVGSDPLGVPGSKFHEKQSWAIFHKYSGTAKKGSDAGNRYGWKLDAPFFFTGLKKGLGIFKIIGKRASMIRTLEDKSVTIRARHKFDKAVSALTPSMMNTIFKRNAEKFLRK